MTTKHIDISSIKHFSVCFILSLIGAYGMRIAIGGAICKKWYDKQSYGHWCWWDLTFDLLGCVVGLGVRGVGAVLKKE